VKAWKTGVAILAAATVAATAGTGAAITGGGPQKAASLGERSVATTTVATTPAWLCSLVIRSEALNDEVRLAAGAYLRSEELNRRFGLGESEVAP
jgi:hypothetical protein